MINKLKKYIVEKNLIHLQDRVLVAVSGGLDSMVLIHLLSQLEVDLAVAHCNFQLRDKESDRDEEFVRSYCEKHGISFFCKRFETNNYASEKGLSIQMAARELRYAWFGELLRHQGFTKLATAHHFNDSIETMLLNWTRGAGLDSLKGILPMRDNIIRPLLFATREEINVYASIHQITWREDISNQTDDYQRNFIRRQIIPQLKRLNVSLENTLRESHFRFEDEWSFYRKAVDKWKNKYVSQVGSQLKISKEGFLEQGHGASLLWQTIRDFGFGYQQAVEMVEALDKQPGKLFLAGDYKLVVDREFFILTKEVILTEVVLEQGQSMATLGSVKMSIALTSLIKPSDNSRQATMDADLIKFPLIWRKWKHGDYFYPLGFPHRKKLSDFLIDQKVPVNLKDSVTVLESDGEIIWVVGHRLDNRYKLTSHTAQSITFTLH